MNDGDDQKPQLTGDADVTQISPLSKQPNFNANHEPYKDNSLGAKIKLVDVGEPSESIQLQDASGPEQPPERNAPLPRRVSPRHTIFSPPANIAPATAQMDKLLADLTVGRSEAVKNNSRKPDSGKVGPVKQGLNENQTQKPDFQKNHVIRQMSLATDTTAFNLDPPSQIMSPTGFGNSDSFLGQRFNSKMIISGTPQVVAGASRIHDQYNGSTQQLGSDNRTSNDMLSLQGGGFQNGIAPPAFDDVSAIIRDEESVTNGANRRRLVQQSAPVRAGFDLDDSESDFHFELDENSKKQGILSPKDINLYLNPKEATPKSGLQIIEEEANSGKTPQSQTQPSTGEAVATGAGTALAAGGKSTKATQSKKGFWPPACCTKKQSQKPVNAVANGPPQPEAASNKKDEDGKQDSKLDQSKSKQVGDLAEIPEEKPGEDTTPQGISGDDLNVTNRALLSPLDAVSAMAVVPAAFSPIDANSRGSMKELQKHKPSSLGFRSFSETLQPQQYFTTEGTPARKITRHMKLDNYEKRKTMQEANRAKEIKANRIQQTDPIFSNKYVQIGALILRSIGVVILSINLILDTSYAFLSTFASMGLLGFYSFLLVVRYAIPVAGIVRNCMYKVNEPVDIKDTASLKSTNSKQAKDDAEYIKQGYFLYGALPFCYLVGTHRLLNFKNASSEMGTGLLIDFFLAGIGFLVIQVLNHGYLSTSATDAGQVYEYNDTQSSAVIFKLILIFELMFEFALYIVELYQLNKFRTRRSSSKQTYALSEKSKRKKYGTQYAMVNAIWTGIIMFIILIASAAAPEQTCRSDQALSNMNDQVCVDCEIKNCGSCATSGIDRCDACKPGFYLLETKDVSECVDANCRIDQCDTCESQGPFVCDQCSPGFFLSDVQHCQSEKCSDAYCYQCDTYGKNICDQCLKDYKFNKATGQCEYAPCHLVNCKQCEEDSTQCLACISGFILDQRQGKCILDKTCDVEGCQTCFDPAVCDICERGLWLDRQVNKCIDGTCHVNNCKVCQSEGPPVCDECQSGFLLLDGVCKSTTCQPGFEYNFQKNECEDKVCKVNYCGLCEAEGIEKCDRCKDEYWLTDQNTCIDATCSDPGCGLCNLEGPDICSICKTDFVLLPEKTCQSSICPSGFNWSAQSLKCEDVTCKIDNCRICEFAGIDGCDACDAGYFFDAVTNTCKLDACSVDNCAKCDGDRSVCESCRSGFFLQGNVCSDGTCDDANCEVCISEGAQTCDQCKANFLLHEGGCKSMVCEQANYEFSFKTLQCEDTLCKSENCARCEKIGLNICDQCEKAYRLEPNTGLCLPDPTCEIKFCDECAADREVCNGCAAGYELKDGTCVNTECKTDGCSSCPLAPEICSECATGLWFDNFALTCVDATCQVDNCEYCSSRGPAWCDGCKKGHTLYDNECRSFMCAEDQRFNLQTGVCEDTVCRVDQCKYCVLSGINACDECSTGFAVSDDKAQCQPDQSCNVLFCEECSADINTCEACQERFWLDKDNNSCIDGSCHVSNCQWCEGNGPKLCDECEPGFTLFENACISTTCPDGFKFNTEAAKCEDTVCKIDGCDDCSQSGIFGCDKCQSDFIYESWSKRCVFDTTCRVQGCAKCEADLQKCEQCAPEFWYDQDNNKCIDGACQVQNCADCSIPGPTKCDKCEAGFFQQDEITCTKCETDGCIECSDSKTCTRCETGRLLEDGICTGCSKNLCLRCDESTGTCARCKSGFYMESDGKTCSPCATGCAECSGPGACLQCDAIKHTRIEPVNGKCYCDQFNGWYPDDASGGVDCKCLSDWLTVDGDCTTCQTAFQGCSSCGKINSNDTDVFTGGIQVMKNEFYPRVDPGLYVCEQCSDATTFFNYDQGYCMRCDRNLSGCVACSENGKCEQCESNYALQENGGCYPCDWHSTGCETCTVDQCEKCKPGYTLLPLFGYCLPPAF